MLTSINADSGDIDFANFKNFTITFSVFTRLGRSWACFKGNFNLQITTVKDRSKPVFNRSKDW